MSTLGVTAMFDTAPLLSLRHRIRRALESRLFPDGYCPVAETNRRADTRSPVNCNYDLGNVLHEVLGRESATCEACQQRVGAAGGGDLRGREWFVIRRLVENVYTLENTVLLCDSCVGQPTVDWKAAVRSKRARARPKPPSLGAMYRYWLTHPTANTLFIRRAAAVYGAVLGLVLTIAGFAGLVAAGLDATNTFLTVAASVLKRTSIIAGWMLDNPWFLGAAMSAGYAAHVIERVRHDPRGARSWDRRPWILLAGTGAIALTGSSALLAASTPVATVPWRLTVPFVGLWLVGAGGVSWYIDRAIRDDRHAGCWYPARLPWLLAGRLAFVPGGLALFAGVPFAEVLVDTTPALLTFLPGAVAVAYVGYRLPHDPRTRDAILEALPERCLALLDRTIDRD